jgi:hypothetical protein
MVYRQPNVDKYVTNGYSFLRLKQELASPGDIFESPQGAWAFALGPDSDISQVNIAYLDEQVPETFLNMLTITPQRSFVNFITAFNNTKNYSPSKAQAKTLIWPSEIYDSTFRPPGFDEENDGLVLETPIIDIIQCFSPTPSIQSQRADKTYYYDTLPFKSSNICYLLIPYYGRRYASIAIQNTSHDEEDPTLIAGKLNVQISGINFRISEGGSALPGFVPLQFLLTLNDDAGHAGAVYNAKSVVLGTGYQQQLAIVHDSADITPPAAPSTSEYAGGLFDYLLIEIDQGEEPAPDVTDASIKIVVSDIVGRTGL